MRSKKVRGALSSTGQTGDALNLETIRHLIPSSIAPLFDIDLYQSVSSTNEVLKQTTRNANTPYKVVIALQQNAGKGRRGKSFYSPSNSGVYISLACAAESYDSAFAGLTAKVGLAVCSAIHASTGLQPKIKWVNDVYLGTKKVCGILCETKTHANDNESGEVIIGVGINVYQPKCVPDDLKDKIGYLANTYTEGLRNRLVASLLAYLHAELTSNSQTYIQRYKELSLLDGREVLIKPEHAQPQRAKVLGINDALQLCVQYADGRFDELTNTDLSIELIS